MLAVIALAMWRLKRHYAVAEVGELAWILNPVARLSALVSGVHFEWEPGAGFLSRERYFVIAKPCAGVNFMLAALGMVGFLLSERAVSWLAGARLTAASAVLAYTATVIANTVRIVAALWLAAHPFATSFWTAARVHRLEGIVVYFGMLVALHLLVRRLAKASDGIAETFFLSGLPLASYYLMTIAVPLANGAGNTGQAFLEHLSFVLLAPLTLVGFSVSLRHAWRRGARMASARGLE
jgi:exosortase K